MSTPKPGWTIEAALQLFADGYSPEQVERMTGFHAKHVEAQAAAQAKEQKRPDGRGIVIPPEPARRPAVVAPKPEPEPFWPDVP